MATDRIRKSFDAGRMYRTVVAQQGRVTVEADANEANDIRVVESRKELIDIIGPTGTPDDGFKISLPGGGRNFAIAAGTVYVGGVRIELAQPTTYDDQGETEWVDRANDPDPAVASRELVYLILAEQEVSAVEDPVLREIALGGPDTSARTRMIQRVHRAPITGTDCAVGFLEVLAKQPLVFDPATMRLESTARLRVDFTSGPTTTDACQPTAQSGFMGAENQLIRVQVTADGKLLWGYDNASFLYRATISGKEITLAGIPVDVFHLPRPDQWIELLDTAVKLDELGAYVASAAGKAFQIESYDPTRNVITLKIAPMLVGTPPQRFVRMWENQVNFVNNATTPTELFTAENVSTGVRIYTNGAPVAADHWLIGVRPGNANLVYPERLRTPQPPDGPRRWATALATIAWTDEVSGTVHDCRRPFESLTEDDDDLSFHNQHLHGWGVVCGLQVQCMTQVDADAHHFEKRKSVVVRNGYAIDPTGSDIIIRSDDADELTPIKLIDLAKADKAFKTLPDGTFDENGTVSLYVKKDGSFGCDPFVPKPPSKWEELLDGTILKDIYEDCVVELINFVKGEVTPGTSDGLVGPVRKRMIAVFNLLAQLLSQTSGRHVYLSGETDPQVLEKEDAILRAFYNELKDKLQSKTFCAMFEGVDYPPYNVYRGNLTPHPTTIFGIGMHKRIRIHPLGKLAYTCGNGNKINVYNLTSNQIVSAIDFPGGTDAEVQDVAFGPNNAIYAIAWIGTAQVDSMFAAGTIKTDGTIDWAGTGNSVTCQLKLVTLATSDATPTLVYAAARGLGIYAFDPAALTTTPTAIREFHASGHLVAAKGRFPNLLFAGDSDQDINSNVFHHVVRIDVRDTSNTLMYCDLSQTQGEVRNGYDDLAVAQSTDNAVNVLMAVIDGTQTGTKQLVVWGDNFEPGGPSRVVELGQSAANSIAYSAAGNWSLVTYKDTYLGSAYRPGSEELVKDVLHPLQVGPVSVATDSAGNWFYVLEEISNTITAIPANADAAAPWTSVIDVPKLETYRVDVITAFLKLLGRLVQYLKDCVCDHILVNCPDPTGKKVYLADISVKNGEVYQICNFHHRKYVHTFPTVEYWMSFVPIIPLIKMAVDKLCCGVLAGFFDQYNPPKEKSAAGADTFSATQLMNSKSYLKDANPKYQWQSLKLQAFAGAMVGKNALIEKLRMPPPGKASTPLASLSFVNKNEDEAKKLAAAKGITVREVVKTSDPMTTAFKVAISSPSIQPGDTVDLITDDKGRVISIAKAGTSTAGTTAPLATAADVTTLKQQLKSMQDLHQQHVATIAEMQKQMTQLKASVDAIK